MDIQKRQREIIHRMFVLAASPSADDDDDSKEPREDAFKLLVFDDFCQEILRPLFKRSDLINKYQVTLTLLLHKDRQRVPDAPAIYFVQPTSANINLIAEDLRKGLYDQMHLNFTSSIPRPLLENLAQSVASGPSEMAGRISKIFDQYVNFIALESTLITLNHQNSYFKLHDPAQTEQQIMSYLDEVVESLFSVAVTLGVVPIIRCRPNEAAAVAAEKLHDKIRDHISSKSNLFAERAAELPALAQRPVLVILDRNIDLAVPLHHPWTYQGLAHDLLGMKNNRVEVKNASGSGSKAASAAAGKMYDLYEDDEFWAENAGHPFQRVAEAVDAKVQEYKSTMNEVSGGKEKDLNFDLTENLQKAVNELPILQRKKALLDMHTNLASALLQQIKARALDNYSSLEESCIQRGMVDRKELLEAIGVGGKGTFEDKLRTLLIYLLTSDGLDADSVKELESTLEQHFAPPAGSDEEKGASAMANPTHARGLLASLAYLKKFKFTAQLTMGGSDAGRSSGSKSGAGASGGAFGVFNALNSIADRMVNVKGIVAGVKNLLPISKDLPVTRIVEAVMENRDSSLIENYLYLDPKRSAQRVQTPFKEGIVFVLGGGSYVEYQNLKEYARRSHAQHGVKHIAYGSTEIVSPAKFLAQLAALGGDRSGNQADVALD